MKKEVILNLSLIILAATLFSCGNKISITSPSINVSPTTSTLPTTSNGVVSDKPGQSVDEKESKFQQISIAIKESQPTIVNTKILYSHPIYNVSLVFQSTLKVEYGFVVKSEYTYYYEKLNELSLEATDFMSSYSGTLYGYNKNFGQYDNDKIEWYVNGNSEIDTLTLQLQYSDFENVSSIDTSFIADVVSGHEQNVIQGLETNSCSNMTFGCELTENYSNVKAINLNYTDKIGAYVDILTTYSYEKVTVDIPNM